MDLSGSERSPGEVRLRGVADGDLEFFFEHQSDPEATRMAAFTARERDPFMAHWARIRVDPAVVVQTVVADGQVAGNVVSWEQSGQRLVGYWIGRNHWGRGVATKALALFVGLDPVRPLHAYVAVHNVGSIRVLEKCGFRRSEAVAVRPASDALDEVEEVRLVLEA